jgi:hypothetical protein
MHALLSDFRAFGLIVAIAKPEAAADGPQL